MEENGYYALKLSNEPTYKTVKVMAEELDIFTYIMTKKGWELSTCFKIGDNRTYLCTYKKAS